MLQDSELVEESKGGANGGVGDANEPSGWDEALQGALMGNDLEGLRLVEALEGARCLSALDEVELVTMLDEELPQTRRATAE